MSATESKKITAEKCTYDDRLSLILEVRVMSPFLSSMNIRHMQLNKGNGDTKKRIPDRNRGVCKSTRVQNNSVRSIRSGFLDSVNDGTLPVTR